MRILMTLLLALVLQNLRAQKIIINGKEGNRPLVWSDFAGKPDESNPYFAYTFWNLNYRFSGVTFNGDQATLQGLEVVLEFNGQASWVKPGKQSDELLKHEQGHFNAALLCLKEVLKTVAAAQFTRGNYKEEIQKIVYGTVQKYKDMNIRYDEETRHSMNKEEQKKWDAFFEKSLQ